MKKEKEILEQLKTDVEGVKTEVAIEEVEEHMMLTDEEKKMFSDEQIEAKRKAMLEEFKAAGTENPEVSEEDVVSALMLDKVRVNYGFLSFDMLS